MVIVECVIFMVTEDNGAGVLVGVVFSYQAGHGWDGAGCVDFTLEAAIILSVYQCVGRVILKALFLLLIAL